MEDAEYIAKIKELEAKIQEKDIVIQEQNVALVEKDVIIQEQKDALKEKDSLLEQEKQKCYELNKQLNEALLKISSYQEKYNIERTRQFIPKSEKLEDIVVNEVEEVIKKEKRTNKGKKYKKTTFNYEKYVTEVKDIYPEEKVCPTCGEKLVDAATDVRYVVNVIPAKIEVTKLVKHKLICPKCNKEDNKIYYPLSNDIFPNSILTPSFAAFIANCKYELGIPFNHLERYISENLGFEITKQNLCNYMIKTAQLLEPIYLRMKEDLLNNESKVIHSDETTLVVSKPEDPNRTKSYVYVYASSFYDNRQIYIYEFNETRSITNTIKWLKDYDGYLITDNFSGYNRLKKENPNIKLQKCWVHVRRRFMDIVKNLTKKERDKSYAYKILNEISKLFKLEEEYKKKKLLKSEIEKQRSIDIPPIKRKIDKLIEECKPAKGTALYTAIEYMKDCYLDLFTYLDNGYCEISNNTCERAVKPFVIQRKVFQTSGSYAGARYTTMLFSIIQTCKINNVNAQAYIEYVLNNLDKPIEIILPYSKNLKV